VTLSQRIIIKDINALKVRVESLGEEKSSLLKIAQESFILGSKSHLNSLNPEIREKLGLELTYLTQRNPKLSSFYEEKKNKYLSLGKSYAAISFLFDLIEEEISLLDLILLQEILMDDGEFRKEDVFIVYPDNSRITFSYKNILSQIEEVFQWYYTVSKNRKISPIVIAILFHYKIVSVHPFLDGNGRVSRLILNLILLKNGLFPISISSERREKYYESLVKGDKGNIEGLIDFVGTLIKEKLEQYLTIAKELEGLEFNKTLLVLTEDGNTEMIQKLLEIHSINLEKTKIESYDGKDNLASAIFFANKLLSKSQNLKHILIHRDRDNDNPQQLKQIVDKHLRSYGLNNKSTVLITKHYDIESYFINSRHINQLYPVITTKKAQDLIEKATFETSPTSKSKLRIAYAEYGKFGKMTDPLIKAKEIDSLYESDPVRYRYGKDVLFKLEELISSELGFAEKIELSQYSDYVKITEVEKCKTKL